MSVREDDGLRTAAWWTVLADEARALAAAMRDPTARALMEDIARKYGLMAERSARREAIGSGSGARGLA